MNFHKQNKTLSISFLSALTKGRRTLKVVYLEDIRLWGRVVCVDFFVVVVKIDNNVFNPSASHMFLETLESFQLKLSKHTTKNRPSDMKNLTKQNTGV